MAAEMGVTKTWGTPYGVPQWGRLIKLQDQNIALPLKVTVREKRPFLEKK